jgi:hypothetical protein
MLSVVKLALEQFGKASGEQSNAEAIPADDSNHPEAETMEKAGTAMTDIPERAPDGSTPEPPGL